MELQKLGRKTQVDESPNCNNDMQGKSDGHTPSSTSGYKQMNKVCKSALWSSFVKGKVEARLCCSLGLRHAIQQGTHQPENLPFVKAIERQQAWANQEGHRVHGKRI